MFPLWYAYPILVTSLIICLTLSTQNAFSEFSEKLGSSEFNIFASLVVDQLHEVELGVWKSLFKHLIRLLHYQGSGAIAEFNRRYVRKSVCCMRDKF